MDIEEPIVPSQRFVLISFTEKAIDEQEKFYRAVKVLGVTSTEEEARKKAEQYQGRTIYDMYVGPVGKWVPFTTDPLSVKEVQYHNKMLTELINENKKQKEQSDLEFLKRVSRESELIAKHNEEIKRMRSEGNTAPEEKDTAPSFRFKIAQLEKRIDMYTRQLKVMKERYQQDYTEAEREHADGLDLPEIEEVAPFSNWIQPGGPSASQLYDSMQ